MKDLLDKLSSYNLFTNLFPGILFCVISSKITNYNLVEDNLILGVFIYYFFGIIISRIGSLLVEPILKKLKVIVYASYKDFISASKTDSKLELLVEVNNTYRTIISTFLCLFIIYLYSLVENRFPMLISARFVVTGITLIFIFIFSYRKQTKYIKDRVENTIKGE